MDIYSRFALRPVVNVSGTMTSLGACVQIIRRQRGLEGFKIAFARGVLHVLSRAAGASVQAENLHGVELLRAPLRAKSGVASVFGPLCGFWLAFRQPQPFSETAGEQLLDRGAPGDGFFILLGPLGELGDKIGFRSGLRAISRQSLLVAPGAPTLGGGRQRSPAPSRGAGSFGDQPPDLLVMPFGQRRLQLAVEPVLAFIRRRALRAALNGPQTPFF